MGRHLPRPGIPQLSARSLKEEDNTHFILLSESCLPIQPLALILLRLQHDGRSRFSFKS
ncbi:MAG: hypothetical protein P1U90_04645 [Akkermansiaceae bacterium]|nr:hypothetical protein [Akkermansiaceae bacterium]